MKRKIRREAKKKLMQELTHLGGTLIPKKQRTAEEVARLGKLYESWSRLAVEVCGEWAKENLKRALTIEEGLKEGEPVETALDRLILAMVVATQRLETEIEESIREEDGDLTPV
jgi:hypothetical protein